MASHAELPDDHLMRPWPGVADWLIAHPGAFGNAIENYDKYMAQPYVSYDWNRPPAAIQLEAASQQIVGACRLLDEVPPAVFAGQTHLFRDTEMAGYFTHIRDMKELREPLAEVKKLVAQGLTAAELKVIEGRGKASEKQVKLASRNPTLRTPEGLEEARDNLAHAKMLRHRLETAIGRCYFALDEMQRHVEDFGPIKDPGAPENDGIAQEAHEATQNTILREIRNQLAHAQDSFLELLPLPVLNKKTEDAPSAADAVPAAEPLPRSVLQNDNHHRDNLLEQDPLIHNLLKTVSRKGFLLHMNYAGKLHTGRDPGASLAMQRFADAQANLDSSIFLLTEIPLIPNEEAVTYIPLYGNKEEMRQARLAEMKVLEDTYRASIAPAEKKMEALNKAIQQGDFAKPQIAAAIGDLRAWMDDYKTPIIPENPKVPATPAIKKPIQDFCEKLLPRMQDELNVMEKLLPKLTAEAMAAKEPQPEPVQPPFSMVIRTQAGGAQRASRMPAVVREAANENKELPG